jgi:hypothetical protein
MKKIVLTLAALLIVSAGTCFAAPINDLSSGETALGIGTDTFYVEHKLSDNFTLGFQNQNPDYYGHMNDVYGQFNLSNNLRAIVGSRNFDPGSKMYAGLAVNGPIASEAQGYASFVAGDQFQELQAGANIRLTHNVDLNLGYHSFMPEFGSNSNGVNVGATIKF